MEEWKKEPRQDCRGLNSKTLSPLESTSLQNLPSVASAHPAQKSVYPLVLAVMRLKRALQRLHPLTVRQEDTRGIITESVYTVKRRDSPSALFILFIFMYPHP